MSPSTQPAGEREDEQRFNGLFERAKVQTYSGTVQNVTRKTPIGRIRPFQVLTLRTDDGRTLTAYLAPASWMQMRKPPLEVGQRVNLRAAPAQLEGQEVLLVETLDRGGLKLQLRQENGTPAWQSSLQHE